MALLKAKTVKGVEANYWRIIDVKTNYTSGNRVNFTIGLHKDDTTRKEDINSVLFKENRFVEIDDIDGNIREQIYTELKGKYISSPVFNWTDFRDSENI